MVMCSFILIYSPFHVMSILYIQNYAADIQILYYTLYKYNILYILVMYLLHDLYSTFFIVFFRIYDIDILTFYIWLDGKLQSVA